MFGFNWVDLSVVLLLVGAVFAGIRIGFISQIFFVIGFFGTLFLLGWLVPYIVRFHDPTVRTIVNATVVLVGATVAGLYSLGFGQNIHWSFRYSKRIRDHKLKLVEAILGSLPGIVAGLLLVWFLGVAVGRLPFAGFSNSVSDALIVQGLTRVLPPVPAVFAEFDKQINPNTQPYVFVSPAPQTSFNYSVSDMMAGAAKAKSSIVRVTSFSCGGIVSGSGFVVAPGLVMTNAHVIAGSKRPIVKYNGRSFETVPILFDPVLDIALLRVQQLAAPPLTITTSTVALNTTVAVLGYPGGNYRVLPGIIRDTRAVSARTIYDQGASGRGIFDVQTNVDYGSSGGPIVLANGQVAGIVFSKSLDVPNNAFALAAPYLTIAAQQAHRATLRVGTGACMVQ